MQNIGKRTLSFLLIGIFILSSTFVTISASALDNGTYTAKCTPYYVHPVTGEVEDRGGKDSVGIGQPMTDSATHTEALIEVDPNGNTFATVRIKLMDNIEDVSFKVQENGNSGFYDVDYDIMQENLDDNTTDFRIQIPNENSYLRATFYVVPMGRYVIYYIGFSDFQPGSGDFITSVEVVTPENPEEPNENDTSSNTESEQPSDNQNDTSSTVSENTDNNNSSSVSTSTSNTVSSQSTVSKSTDTDKGKSQNTSSAKSVSSDKDTSTDKSSKSTSSVIDTSTDKKLSSDTDSSTDKNTDSANNTSSVGVDVSKDDPMPEIAENDENDGNGVIIYDEKGNKLMLADVIGGTAEVVENNSNSNNFPVIIVICCGGAAAVGAVIAAVVRSAKKRGNK